MRIVRMLCKFFNCSLPRILLFLHLEISSSEILASSTCMRITDIKEVIVTHLSLLFLGTPVSMKLQSDSAS